MPTVLFKKSVRFETKRQEDKFILTFHGTIIFTDVFIKIKGEGTITPLTYGIVQTFTFHKAQF